MGTTLTGTTPANTYDSLIKVTDNGPLSGTAKYLSDGLGNDSALALSNARVGVATTSPLTTLQVGNTTIDNAAIGSSLIRLLSRSTANDVQEIGLGGEGSATMSAIGNIITDGSSFAKGAIYFATRDVVTNTAPTERMRITSAGNVGIGDPSPSYILDVNNTSSRVRFKANTGDSNIELSSIAGRDWLVSSKTDGAFSIYDEDASSERMRITSTGQVLIGTSSAQAGTALQVAGVFDVWNSANTLLRSRHDGTRGLIQGYAGGAVSPIGINVEGGNVGIGTASPAFKLDVVGTIKANQDAAAANGIGLVLRNTGGGGGESIGLVLSAQNQQTNSQIRSIRVSSSLAEDIQFFTGTNDVSTEKVRILAGGGITFNGDTAAANALDDYEEGTWAMGITFGGASTGVTYGANSGTYTRIGRQVTVNGYLLLSNKGTATGNARLTGLPYTIGGANGNLAAASLYFENISFANQFMGFAIAGQTNCALYEITEAGVYTVLNETNFTNNSAIIVSLTYFV